MKTVILFYSRHHGNTKKLLDAIAAADPDVDLVDVTTAGKTDLSGYDRIGIASGIYYSSFAKQVINFAEENLPEGLEPLEIPWEAVSEDDHLLPESKVRAYIESLMYEPSNSEFVGEIGDKIEEILTVTRAITLDGYYGTSTMHIMEDADGDVYVWTTAAKSFPEGKVVHLRGTIKDHREYKGTKQTILTRCREIAE